MSKAPSRSRKKKTASGSKTGSSKARNHKKNKKKAYARKRSAKSAGSWRRRLFQVLVGFILAGLLVAAVSVWFLDRSIRQAFEGRRWDVPAHIYAQPLELFEGRPMAVGELEQALVQLGYKKQAKAGKAGTFSRSRSAIELVARPFKFWDEAEPERSAFVRFQDGRISALTDAAQRSRVPIVRLDPLLMGSLYPGVVEDRIVTSPDAIPVLLSKTLLTVEDKRFYAHHGLDFYGIARAMWVNLRSGELRQGGSTLTQQLVKSYFLDNRRTLRRKIVEAAMAMLLERRYDKDAVLTAYVNEIYLGQDGARAIHGFALASRYHFGRPLDELEPHQLALLVAIVRGPSYYDPRKHPQRALERRNLVLGLMADAELLEPGDAATESARPLGLADKPVRGASYFPAFMAIVRQQLVRDYQVEDLAKSGLQVFTTLDPLVQSRAERALSERIDKLEKNVAAGLEGAMLVTSVDGAEIEAAVGGRDPSFDGFNRVLNAKRLAGSLMKSVVYLAALESGKLNLASIIDDSSLTIKLENGETYTPRNYDGLFAGPVPALRAFAESRNIPAVRVGMATGLEKVAELLGRLGFERKIQVFPSLLLGAVSMSPFEVAQVYNTLAAGGAYTPLNSVRFVLDEGGEQLGRYALRVRQVVAPQYVTQLNVGLMTAMRRGTGRSARARLPADMEVAGKTGTTDELRDSWFAGFSADRLAVVWIGRDDNSPAGLSGAAGALQVWADFFAGQGGQSLVLDMDDSLRATWIDYQTGLESRADCGDTVPIAVPTTAEIEPQPGCEPGVTPGVGKKALKWLKDVIG